MNRYAFTMEVKAGMQEEYIRRHQAVWPAVQAACQQAGIKNYTLFMRDHLVFAYLECEDFTAATEFLAADPEVEKWEQYMAPIMAAARVNEAGEGTRMLQKVFHLE